MLNKLFLARPMIGKSQASNQIHKTIYDDEKEKASNQDGRIYFVHIHLYLQYDNQYKKYLCKIPEISSDLLVFI